MWHRRKLEACYHAGPADAVQRLGLSIAATLRGKGGGRPGMYSGKGTRLEAREEGCSFITRAEKPKPDRGMTETAASVHDFTSAIS